MNDVEISPAQIRSFRAQNRLSQARLAALLGVSRRTIQHYEEGRAIPKCRTRMLAKLFVEDHRGPRDDIDHLKDKIIALQEDKIRDLERNNAKLDLILVQMQKIIDGLELGVAR